MTRGKCHPSYSGTIARIDADHETESPEAIVVNVPRIGQLELDFSRAKMTLKEGTNF